MDPFHEVLVEAGEIVGRTHYRFATDLLWENVLKDVPDAERQKRVEEWMQRTSRLSQLVKTIDDVFVCYMKDRGLP
jgi:hypothetical protein